MKCLKFYGYFVLLFVLLFITCPNVKAGTIEEVSEEYVANMLDFYANMYNERGYTTKYNILQNAHADTVANYINNDVYAYINNYLDSNSKLNLENLIFYARINNDSSVQILIIPAKSNANDNQILNNRDIQYIKYENDNEAIKLNGVSNWIPLAVYFTIQNNNQITNAGVYTLTGYIRLTPWINPTVSGDYIYSDVLYAPSSETKLYYNNIEYKIGNYYESINQQMQNTDQSEYGYLWSPASSREARVNLLYSGNSNIDCDYYIGNALSHTYNFYYMSGDSKISVNDYISIYTTQTTSGKWYKHYITNSGKEHLPNNTHFLFDVYASLGNQTATVVEGFNAFYTVEEVIPTPTPIPTATPTPTPDIGTISGQINDINNNINNSTQTIVEQISGDTQKITESIEEVQEFLSEEIDNNKSGEIESALNIEVEITDPTSDFFSWFFNQIKECFTVTGNQTLTFEILENQITINSDDYIINIPILSTILGTGSGIFILYGILQDIRKEIEKIKEGKFEEIGKEDISANML